MPRARSRSSRPTFPGRSRRSSASLSAASAPTVSTPAAAAAPRRAARPPEPAHVERRQERRLAAGRTTVSPPGLRRSLAILATTFEVATPTRRSGSSRRAPRPARPRRGRAPRRSLARPRRGRGSPRRAPCARRSARPRGRRPRPRRVLAVDAVPRTDEDRVRAAAKRLGAAHRRVDPVPARHVVRGRDDAAPVRVASDDERLRPQLGLLELLDGGEERVEIEVGDDHAHEPSHGCESFAGQLSPSRRQRIRSWRRLSSVRQKRTSPGSA